MIAAAVALARRLDEPLDGPDDALGLELGGVESAGDALGARGRLAGGAGERGGRVGGLGRYAGAAQAALEDGGHDPEARDVLAQVVVDVLADLAHDAVRDLQELALEALALRHLLDQPRVRHRQLEGSRAHGALEAPLAVALGLH